MLAIMGPSGRLDRQIHAANILFLVCITSPGKSCCSPVCSWSGAGKSTLLNIIAGRIGSGEVSGEVLVNGRRPGELYRSNMGYVEQEDYLFPNLTVLETLRVAASLQLPADLTTEEKHERVDRVVQSLGLGGIVNSLVGGPLARGISGGERKRVAIASELLRNPSVLLLDEPISGLDSFYAFNIMNTLRTVASTRRCVIVTIHQPRESIFNMFDKVMFISEGRIVYFGPTRRVPEFLNAQGISCPWGTNPADVVMDNITADSSSIESSARSRERIQALAENYERSHHSSLAACIGASSASTTFEPVAIGGVRPCEARAHADTQPMSDSVFLNDRASIYQLVLPIAEPFKAEGTAIHSTGTGAETDSKACGDCSVDTSELRAQRFSNRLRMYQASWITELVVLSHRSLLNYVRDTQVLVFGALQTAFVALIVGLVFFGVSRDQTGVQNRVGAIYYILINNIFGAAFGVLDSFPREYRIFRRERLLNSYRTWTYFLAKSVVEVPMQLPLPLLSMITYFMIGFQRDTGTILTFIALLLASAFCGQSLGFAISASTDSVVVGQVLAQLLLLVLLLVSGFYANNDSLLAELRWIVSASFVSYAYKGALQNEFSGLTFDCRTNSANTGCSFRTGDDVIQFYKVGNPSIWMCFTFVIGQAVCFRVLAYFLLNYRSRPPKARRAS
jgi:ABC-type multidrug transport system ATPase subunit/ABC-type multidrug transport system permease subunit